VEGAPGSLSLEPIISALPQRSRSAVRTDIESLAASFAPLTGRDHVRIELSVVRGAGCRKLHVDYVGLRLLSTYVGAGTQWLEARDVCREHLGRADLDADENNELILRADGVLRETDCHDVVLFKGESFRGNGGRGAVHRSPPLAAGEQSRLLLKMDVAQCGC